jgi:antitoxin VapB
MKMKKQPTEFEVTKTFMSGNSQAIRIPFDLRLDTKNALIRRNERGELVIIERPTDFSEVLECLSTIEDPIPDLDREYNQPYQERDL